MLCIAAMGLFTSCSKDNDVLIVGKWKCTVCTYTVTDLSTNEMEQEDDESTVGMIIEFTSDGKMISSETTSSYTVSGNELTISYGGREEYKYDIKKLTNSKLIISSEFEENQHYRYTEKLEFERM